MYLRTGKKSYPWERDHALTTILVNLLTTYPSDQYILFYLDGKKAIPAIGDAPLGKDKNEIHNVIARLIHPKYKSKCKFNVTGAGVVLLDITISQNLLDEVNTGLP
ncbi:hypothetical protein EDD22DRAFT_844583 [Suillus occidentalis]|nr:hypothetical protein EDD22DRAFT_844583 [Suillus occidentalis]